MGSRFLIVFRNFLFSYDCRFLHSYKKSHRPSTQLSAIVTSCITIIYHNPPKLLLVQCMDSIQISLVLYALIVCSCVCLVLCNFITSVGLCDQHHNQGSFATRSPVLPFTVIGTSRLLTLLNSWQPLISSTSL